MNIMIVAATPELSPAFPAQEGALFALGLAVAGALLLTAAVSLTRRGETREAVRYSTQRW
jgi:hypothetical protein